MGRTRRKTRSMDRRCRGCGVCCELYGHTLRATDTDRARWRAQGRDDILCWVGQGGELWIDPQTGDSVEPCPFLDRVDLDRAGCRIHTTKPQMCRAYPTRAHGYRCACGVRFADANDG